MPKVCLISAFWRVFFSQFKLKACLFSAFWRVFFLSISISIFPFKIEFKSKVCLFSAFWRVFSIEDVDVFLSISYFTSSPRASSFYFFLSSPKFKSWINLFQHTFENNSIYVLEKYSFNWTHAVFEYLKQIQHFENHSMLSFSTYCSRCSRCSCGLNWISFNWCLIFVFKNYSTWWFGSLNIIHFFQSPKFDL